MPKSKAKSTLATKPKFTARWFKPNAPTWKKHLSGLRGKSIRYLEIGTYEGESLRWMFNNVLTSTLSSATVVDPFTGSVEHKDFDVDFGAVYARFKHNTDQWRDRIRLCRNFSSVCLPDLLLESREFDVIYIDGSHTASDVLFDAILCWRLLAPGGILIFDDYTWDLYKDKRLTPKRGIDAFLSVEKGNYVLMEKDWQVFLRKEAVLAVNPNLKAKYTNGIS